MCNCKQYLATGRVVTARRQYRDGQEGMKSALESGSRGDYHLSGALDVDKASLAVGIDTLGRVAVSRGVYVNVKRSGLDGIWYYELSGLPASIGDNFLAL